MSPRKNKCECWGYLLPTGGKLPAIPLEFKVVTVGSGANCEVRAEQVGCTLFKRHFEVIRSPSYTQIKNNSTKHIYVNTNAVASGQQTELQNNAIIAISSLDNKVLLYADKATSDNSDFNSEITKKYVVAHKLGQGGYGQVFLVIEKRNHEQFAMKVTGQNTYSRREAAIARKLDHILSHVIENIFSHIMENTHLFLVLNGCTVFTSISWYRLEQNESSTKVCLIYGSDNLEDPEPCIVPIRKIVINPDKMYLVMDYLRGGDLSRWVNFRKLLTEQQMKLIFYQIALAVMHLHMKGIGHRDLKPSNILLQDTGPCTLIKVTDFGLAKQEYVHSAMKTTAGSEPYMAPEVVNSKTYTKEVDVWSMGIILFYSLCGSLPFRDVADATSKGHKVMFIPKKWAGVSSAAVNLVKNMLEINPEKRIKVNKILQDNWLQDEGMKAKAETVMGKTSEQIQMSASVKSGQNKNENVSPNRKQPVPVRGPREYIPPRGVNQFMKSNQVLQRRERNIPFWTRLNVSRCNIM